MSEANGGDKTVAAANGYKRLHGLTVEQQNAVDRLVAGDTDQQTADAVGVHRTSVTRWRLYDPHFQAALNIRRQEVFGSAVDKLRALTHKALDTLATAMDAGNVLAAVTVLKAAALDKNAPPPAEPTDADRIIGALVESRMADKREKRRRTQSNTENMLDMLNPERVAKQEAEDAKASIREVADEIEARLRDVEAPEPATATDTCNLADTAPPQAEAF